MKNHYFSVFEEDILLSSEGMIMYAYVRNFPGSLQCKYLLGLLNFERNW